MRFLVMVKPNSAEVARYEAGHFPEDFREQLEKMGAFNQTLIDDGMLVDMGGLQPTSEGVRIAFTGAKPQITDGPFTETKELISGFWLLKARSTEELVKRLSQCPFPYGESIEIRPLFSDEDIDPISA
jgi:hypothetical protein